MTRSGGLRLHGHVRLVRFGPSCLLTSAAIVHVVRLVRPGPARAAESRAGTVRNSRCVCPTACPTIGSWARRQKRPISLPSHLADAIDQAATAAGTTVGAWIAETAAHRLRIDAGRHGVAEWDRQHGAPRRLPRARGLPTVPTPALAEGWRGGPRQASLARFLALCTTESLTDEQAKAVGTLAARAGHDDVVE